MVGRTVGLVVSGLVTALVAAGCSASQDTSDTDAPGSDSSTAAAFDDPFLDEVAATDSTVDEALDTFVERTTTRYTNREAFFDALGDLDPRDNFRTVLDNAGALTPPAEYEEPFRIWFDSVQESVDLAEDFEAGIESGDLAEAAMPAALINSTYAGVLIELTALSPDFCRAVTAGADGPDDDSCIVAEELPGGDYGRGANLIARETGAIVFPLIGTPPLSLMSDDEEVRYLAQIQPTVEDEFDRGRRRLGELTPPPDLQDDHDAVLTYLEDIAEIARRITAAAEAEDQDALRPLYDSSGLPGSTLSRTLSEDGTRIFATFVPAG